MTQEEKDVQLKVLYNQLDACGQILAEWDEDRPPTKYKQEYRRILKAIIKLDPESWKDCQIFQKKNNTKINTAVDKFCKEHVCPKCGGEIKQTRSGSLRVICKKCNAKYQLKK